MTTNTLITKERVKDWNACADGFKWLIDNYKPAEVEFVPVYQHLIRDKRSGDADWLMGKLFEELGTECRVKLVTQIAGADAKLIAEQQAAGAPGVTTEDDANAATTGNYANAATTGECAVAASLGIHAKAKASATGGIVLAWRDQRGKLLGIRASMVGENNIQPDVWYTLNDAGEFVESEE